MHRIGSLVLAGLAIACGTPPPRATPDTPPPLPPVEVALAPAPVAPPPPEEPETRTPPPLAAPACTFGQEQGELRSSLGFVAGGKRFATIAGKVTLERLELAAGNERAYAVVDDGRVRLAAEVAPKTIRLGPRDPAPVDGWLEIEQARVATVVPGQVGLDVPLPGRFTPVAPLGILERRCDELTPMTRPTPPSGEYTRIEAGRQVPISATPGGAVVGHLFRAKPKPAPSTAMLGALATDDLLLDMQKLTERGGHARVRVTTGASAVVGWVPKAALEPGQVGVLGVLSGMGDGDGPTVTCERDVELLVEVDGVRHRVGTLHAGAAVPVITPDGRPIVLRLSSLLDSLFSTGEPLHPVRPVIAPDQASSCRIR